MKKLLNHETKWDMSLAQLSSKAVWEIVDCLHNAGVQLSESLVLIIAYLSYITKCDSVATLEEMLETDEYMDEAVKCIVRKELNDGLWQQIVRATEKCEPDVFKYIVLTPNVASVSMPSKFDDTTTP
ncbi:MAG: hypothetical protein ACI4PV_00230, partial [Butyricicoccus sp.]